MDAWLVVVLVIAAFGGGTVAGFRWCKADLDGEVARSRAELFQGQTWVFNESQQIQMQTAELRCKEQKFEEARRGIEELIQRYDAHYKRERKDIERRKALVKKAEAMLRRGPQKEGAAALGQYLREHHLRGVLIGKHVTVTFLGERSGFVAIRWAVKADEGSPPLIVIAKRDGKLIRRDWGSDNELTDHLEAGKRYLYTFCAYNEEGQQVGGEVLGELALPAPGDWKLVTDRGGEVEEEFKKLADREQRIGRAKSRYVRKSHAEIEAAHLTPEEAEAEKATVEAFASQVADEVRNKVGG